MRQATFREKIGQRAELTGDEFLVKPAGVLSRFLPGYLRIALEHFLHLMNGFSICNRIRERDGVNGSALPKPRKNIERTHLCAGVSGVERLPKCEQNLHGQVPSQEGRTTSEYLPEPGPQKAKCSRVGCDDRTVSSRSRKMRHHNSKFSNRQQPSVADELPWR